MKLDFYKLVFEMRKVQEESNRYKKGDSFLYYLSNGKRLDLEKKVDEAIRDALKDPDKLFLPAQQEDKFMELAKRGAKELFLEEWDWLCRNQYKHKEDFPKEIMKKVEGHTSWCPLCTLFYKETGPCSGCPLDCLNNRSLQCWRLGINKQENSQKIYEQIKAWDV